MVSDDGDRRRLVFANLANGVPVAQVMQAQKMSEKEVMDAFSFMSKKIVSYRFERGMPLYPCLTIADAQANRVEFLWTLQRINPDKGPLFGRIETLPFNPEPGRPGPAEQKLLELRMRRGA